MSNQNKFYVYVYSDPRNSVPFYVGKGEGKRYRAHLTIANQENHRYYNLPVANKIRKLRREGIEPKIEKKFKGLAEEEAFEKETELIIKIGRRKSVGGDGSGPLLNLSDGGEGASGWKMSKESKEKIRRAKLGEKNPMWGKTTSKRQKEAARQANLGKTVSGETREKLRKANSGENHPCYGKFGPEHPRYGKKFSQESIDKVRKSLGKKKGKLYALITPNGEVFKIKNTLSNICREYNLSYRAMLHVLNKEQKDHKGWTIEYACINYN